MPDLEADYEIDIDWSEAAPSSRAVPARVRTAQAIPAKADRELAQVQALAAEAALRESDPEAKEGVIATGDHVTLLGKDFRVAERIGLMPLLKFASAADVDVQDSRALAALYALLRDCIYGGEPGCGECADCETGNDTSCKSYARGDWLAFEEHAMVTKADAEDLMAVVQDVLEIVSGRPTPPRAGSAPGQRGTRRGSTGSSSGTKRRASKR